MAVKLRLQRHGRKKKPFYHIVVADARAPRDGKFIEKLGVYNPNTNPATIELALDKAVDWLENGAQPSDTVRAILSYKGVLFKKHLNRGVKKGALTQEQADVQFNEWLGKKTGLVESKVDRLSRERADLMASRLKQETLKKEAIAAKVLAKNTPEAEAPSEVNDTVENVETSEIQDSTTTEVVDSVEVPTVEETPVAEETTEVVKETPEEEVETPVAEEINEVVEETPVVEEETPVVEETPEVVEETPAVEEETPVAEETTEVTEETPEVEEETPVVEDNKEDKEETSEEDTETEKEKE